MIEDILSNTNITKVLPSHTFFLESYRGRHFTKTKVYIEKEEGRGPEITGSTQGKGRENCQNLCEGQSQTNVLQE